MSFFLLFFNKLLIKSVIKQIPALNAKEIESPHLLGAFEEIRRLIPHGISFNSWLSTKAALYPIFIKKFFIEKKRV